MRKEEGLGSCNQWESYDSAHSRHSLVTRWKYEIYSQTQTNLSKRRRRRKAAKKGIRNEKKKSKIQSAEGSRLTLRRRRRCPAVKKFVLIGPCPLCISNYAKRKHSETKEKKKEKGGGRVVVGSNMADGSNPSASTTTTQHTLKKT